MVAILITFNSLHKDFDTSMASLLEANDKTIDQIQSILQSIDAKNISKGAIEDGTSNLAMAFKDKNTLKKKANSDDECYNCHKLGYFGRNYLLFDRKLNKNTQ